MQSNKALVGFLTHTGYAHGGNGYEGIAYLNDQFKDSGLTDPTTGTTASTSRRSPRKPSRSTRRDSTSAETDRRQPRHRQAAGVNHQVFKDKSVNHDPREVFIARLFEERGETNVFHAFYRALVQELLLDASVRERLLPYNIDAVIAALLLKMLWKPLHAGKIGERDLETAAFTIFLYPRMLGCAAEIDEVRHLNRGRNMDTRTVASVCKFVA